MYGFYGCVGWGAVSAKDYIGRWELAGPDGQMAKLILHEGGTLSVENTPRVIFALGGYSKPDWRNTIDLTGDWEIDGSAGIWIHTELAGNKLWVTGRDWGMKLNIVAGGSPDQSPIFTFRRG